jgi:hypothetical protein
MFYHPIKAEVPITDGQQLQQVEGTLVGRWLQARRLPHHVATNDGKWGRITYPLVI